MINRRTIKSQARQARHNICGCKEVNNTLQGTGYGDTRVETLDVAPSSSPNDFYLLSRNPSENELWTTWTSREELGENASERVSE